MAELKGASNNSVDSFPENMYRNIQLAFQIEDDLFLYVDINHCDSHI